MCLPLLPERYSTALSLLHIPSLYSSLFDVIVLHIYSFLSVFFARINFQEVRKLVLFTAVLRTRTASQSQLSTNIPLMMHEQLERSGRVHFFPPTCTGFQHFI